ncbi:MAG: [FeFe] hydrogenase H-cluster radical SAM maturase HydG [bacterium]|nr:[FeFe] hydrogenase H-cluster radical SAM maturase HydG [bacterium]
MLKNFIDEETLLQLASLSTEPGIAAINEILEKGRRLEGLTAQEAALLLQVQDVDALKDIFNTASAIKKSIYGDRLVFFAPLYLSSYCVNDCSYCGFHASNKAPRKKLTMDEIREQTARLIEMGHKRLLLEFGEDPNQNDIDYICDAIKAIYSVKRADGEIRRVNVNIAATSVEDYRRLKERGIGTYQLFQETYHRKTYERLHKGPKGDFDRQLFAMDRAFEAGLDDVGIGVLFGLYDYRFELLALITHADYLQNKYGVGPHTISVPRFRPAANVEMSALSPLSDEEFLKLIAILRIAIPYTGIIITTRESAEIREKAFNIGVTQTSAASCTSPGGFGKKNGEETEQFELSDKRSLDEIAISVMKQGFTPSFCTACYRKSRTGEAFMEIARPGDIHRFCRPNGILTLMEYVEDHASKEGVRLGLETIKKDLEDIDSALLRKKTMDRLERIRNGERDIYF